MSMLQPSGSEPDLYSVPGLEPPPVFERAPQPVATAEQLASQKAIKEYAAWKGSWWRFVTPTRILETIHSGTAMEQLHCRKLGIFERASRAKVKALADVFEYCRSPKHAIDDTVLR